MKVFTFTCIDCKSVISIPVVDIRQRRTPPPPHWCPTCGVPLTVDVVDDGVPLDAA